MPFDALPLAAPALPLDEAGKYVAGAYIVFVVMLVVYLAIMAVKVQRIERELRELANVAEEKRDPDRPGREPSDSSSRLGAAERAGDVRGVGSAPLPADRDLAPSEAVGGPGASSRGDRDE